MEGEGSGTKITGVIVRGEGVTKVKCSARLGMAGILVPLLGLGAVALGVTSNSNVVHEQHVLLAVLGTVALMSLLRWHQVRVFWKETGEMMDTLRYILRANTVAPTWDDAKHDQDSVH